MERRWARYSGGGPDRSEVEADPEARRLRELAERLDVGGVDGRAAPDAQARRGVAIAGDVEGCALRFEQRGHRLYPRLVGARDVLLVAPISAVIGVVAGTLLGLLMGYYRGLVDDVAHKVAALEQRVAAAEQHVANLRMRCDVVERLLPLRAAERVLAAGLADARRFGRAEHRAHVEVELRRGAPVQAQFLLAVVAARGGGIGFVVVAVRVGIDSPPEV